MKKRIIVIVILLILVGLGVAGWYLISPLFISDTVDEPFPEVEEPVVLESMPTAEELEQMTEAEKELIKDQVLEMYAESPPKAIDDSMDEMIFETPVSEMFADDEVEELAASSDPVKVASGRFKDADSFHKGSGDAGIYTLADGSRVLRLEDFSVTNGPALHVLLSDTSNPIDRASLGDYVDLGELKGNAGNQNYFLPENIDVDKYNSVVIYCKPFHVIFSTAQLQG